MVDLREEMSIIEKWLTRRLVKSRKLAGHVERTKTACHNGMCAPGEENEDIEEGEEADRAWNGLTARKSNTNTEKAEIKYTRAG